MLVNSQLTCLLPVGIVKAIIVVSNILSLSLSALTTINNRAFNLFPPQMSSKSHMQELQLEKEKVNEVRVDESFDKKVKQTARQKYRSL